MTPAPSTSEAGLSSGSGQSTTTATLPPASSSPPSRSTRQRSRSGRQDPFSLPSLQGLTSYNSDLKHCAVCGQLLELLVADSALSPPSSVRVISVGSHAFEVPLDQSMQSDSQDVQRDISGTLGSATTMTEDGRPICSLCSDSLPLIAHVDHVDNAMDLDSTQTTASDPNRPASGESVRFHEASHPPQSENPRSTSTERASGIDAASGSRSVRLDDPSSLHTLSNSTSLSISIASGSRSRSPHSEDEAAIAQTESLRASSPPRGRHLTSGMTLAELIRRNSRDQSFTRTQRSPTLQGLEGTSFILGCEPPVVSVPSTNTATTRSEGSWREATGSTSRVGVCSEESDSILLQTAGPSAMTLPRLTTLRARASRVETSSACLTSTDIATIARPRESMWSSRLAWFRPERPDPMADISRIRMPPKGRGCLYPGSIYNGTQKSGRLSYDVTVEILNVDLTNSHLDGYLNIRGLTEDWPELTTFFTAEIIGKDYGFVTGRWGATEGDDMKHWSRFGPFKALHSTLPEKEMRFNHLNKPFVFMRWKERFLVPDWRVRDISGASFAGFYYVCAELGDPSEWTSGSVDPSTTRFSATVPSLSSATSSMDRREAEDATGHRTRTPVSRRRLGSQNSPLGPSSNEVDPQRTTTSNAGSDLLNWLGPNSGPRAVAANLSLLSEARAALEGSTEDREMYWRTRRLRDVALSAESPSRAQSRERARSRIGRAASGGGSITGDVMMEDGAASEETDTTKAPPGPTVPSPHSTPATTSLIGGRVSAFYYHENSEPYQQLDLRHVEKRSSEAFEMR